MLTFTRWADGDEQQTMALGNSLTPTAYTPLRDEVLATLRQALISGGFVAGERIREVELAAKLGVSRGTLREALRHLEQEGLIITNPHRGTFVVKLTPGEADDIYGLRIALEAYAVERAAELVTPDDLEQLQAAVEAFRTVVRTERSALGPRVELDLQFHELICDLSGNARLLRTWKELCGPLRLLLSTFQRPYMSGAPDHHQFVVDALRDGQAAKARDILTEHLVDSRDRLLTALRSTMRDEEPIGS
jgi:DNA-binding GntR family transcriptional regulator